MKLSAENAHGHFSLSDDFCCGLFSVSERLRRTLPEGGKDFRPVPGLLRARIPVLPDTPSDFYFNGTSVLTYQGGGRRIELNEADCVFIEDPIELFSLHSQMAEEDRLLMDEEEFLHVLPEGVALRGGRKDLLIHKTARIAGPVSVSTEAGPVVIDARASVKPFSVLEGPLYIGPDSIIESARIRASYIGEACRMGGEVEESIFHPFSNKHHEGFIGHSVIGRWVNLGALTTGSDLKNNYSPVHFPDAQGERKATPLLKLGALIGDHVKTGIGTLLNTGSRISLGSLIAGGGMAPTWLPPFSWHVDGRTRLYEIRSFIHTEKIVMGRRKQEMSEDYEEQMRAVFNASKRFHQKGEGR
ncbi:MAG TPA: hypothetical protein PLF44_06505 [Candidatus Mcinerneyibacteriales bacterium]|nr:hypothetical protein [Candidatus Mcinerneyibacteriales bacterium]HPJ70513.1 hypothetical protein [Candidatus Mcinerneyibacteriales bacterium]